MLSIGRKCEHIQKRLYACLDRKYYYHTPSVRAGPIMGPAGSLALWQGRPIVVREAVGAGLIGKTEEMDSICSSP